MNKVNIEGNTDTERRLIIAKDLRGIIDLLPHTDTTYIEGIPKRTPLSVKKYEINSKGYIEFEMESTWEYQFKEIIYQGWMISSSPTLTPFEHPTYDVWVKDCKIDIESE